MKHLAKLVVLSVSIAGLAGCGSDKKSTPAPASFTLNFKGVVGTQPFACGTSYTGVGTTGATWSPKDFRFYVHDVRLVKAGGVEVPLTLDEVSNWQHSGVALVDLEDGTGDCATGGDAATRTTVTGKAEAGTYTGVKFKVGVPFAQNHLDVATAAAPLDRTALFWSWTAGYKYARIDGTNTSAATPKAINVHLGATGCTPVDQADPSKGVTGCTAPNIPDVSLALDPATDDIVLDAGALLAGVNLDTDGGGAPGCMSGPTDPECGPVFSKLGLAWGGNAAGAQAIFSKGGTPTSVQLAFKGAVAGAPFACGTTYTGLGTTGATYSPKDFRFYVHDVRLLTATGDVPVTLDDVTGWQNAGVALVDLEDASGDCAALGDAATRAVVSGTVAPGTYTGVSFKVGVPFAQNHLDVATATAPLNRTALFWSWTAGYKYLRIDGIDTSAPTPKTVNVHLGATGCTPVDQADPSKGVTGCTAPNEVTVSLPAVPGTNRLVIDLATLLEGVNLDTDGGGAPGCMSGPTDPECGPVFGKLGLPWGGNAAVTQTLFSVE